MRFPPSILPQVALIFVVVLSERTQEICKGDHTDCLAVPYTTGDENNDASCREECARQRAGLTEKTTAYYCGEFDQFCSAYDIYGRRGDGRIFERHVMCVLMCQLTGQGAPSLFALNNHYTFTLHSLLVTVKLGLRHLRKQLRIKHNL
ncbi:hypothetical protein SprV_0602184300 [Sparganum proliferum]